MLIQPAKYKTVKRQVRERISADIYGCDYCRTPIRDGERYLEVTVFHHDKDADNHQFCSWKCVVAYLPKIKSTYFVSLPFLYYDQGKDAPPEGQSVEDFLKLLK